MSEIKKIDRLALVHIQGKKLLSVKNRGKDKFYPPGGKREIGESDVQALTREIKEELNVDILEDTLKFMDVFEGQAHGKPEGVMVKLTCYMGDFKGDIKINEELEDITYLGYEDREQFPKEQMMIFNWLKERNLV
jgi:8-oxo-dGTP pyrophosphatase MutT (NUDIX family)